MPNIQSLSFDDIPSANTKPKRDIKALAFDDVANKPEDPGAMGAAWLGFGRTADKAVQGVKQAGYALQSLLPGSAGEAGQQNLDEQKQTQQMRDEGYAPVQQQHPVASMVGEAAPLVALPMGGSLRAAAAIGAAPGLLEYGTPQEKLLNAGAGTLGGSAGYGVGKAIGSLVSPGMKAASPEAFRLAQVAVEEGIPLDAAQATGNPVLQNMKAALAKVPWTASGQAAKAQSTQEAYNAALLRQIGSDAKAGTPDVMGDAYSATVSKMDKAAKSAALTPDDPFIAKLAEVEKNYFRRLPTDQKAVIGSYIEDLTGLIGKEMPGDVYNKTRSELGRIAFNTDNSTMREGAKGLQKALDDMFDRQAPKEAVAAMKQSRSEYSKYLTLENAIKKGRSQDGNFGPRQVYAQAQQDIPGFNRGKGERFADITRAGRQFLPETIPNSGTPQQMAYMNLLTAGSLSGLGALGGAVTGEDGKGAIPGAALGLAGFGVSKAAQKALNSPALTKYLMNETLSAEQKRIIAQGGGLLGLGFAGQ